jgi:hypothetical protein
MTPRQQLDVWMDRYTDDVATLARAVFAWMRKKFPAANVIVYDNYNALAIGFATTDKGSGAVFSIVLYPRWVNFFFLNGATLPDPQKLLKGSGKRVRSITLHNRDALREPAMIALIDAEAKRSGLSSLTDSRGPIVIKAVSAKQRPRRPVAPAKKSSRK